MDSFYQPRKCGFRWNSLVDGDKAEVIRELSETVTPIHGLDWFEKGFFVDSLLRESLLDSQPAEKSQIYIQNPSSMLPCLILDPRPGETVLDLAAAPGGKTLLLSDLMKNEGQISAVEPIRSRFFKLQANLKRYGSTITKTYMTDGRSVGRKVPERFDRVLIDVPCSGESRIHQTDAKSFQFWSERKIKEQSRKQYGLIRSGFESLRPGGRLVYCTCSFAPEENEKVVSDFLGDQPAASLEDIKVPGGIAFENGLAEWNGNQMHEEIARSVRIIPDQLMNGFFIASIQKQAV